MGAALVTPREARARETPPLAAELNGEEGPQRVSDMFGRPALSTYGIVGWIEIGVAHPRGSGFEIVRHGVSPNFTTLQPVLCRVMPWGKRVDHFVNASEECADTVRREWFNRGFRCCEDLSGPVWDILQGEK